MSKLPLILLLSLLQSPFCNAVAAPAKSNQAESPPLGRLFSTPTQRNYLDKARRQFKATGTEFTEDTTLTFNLKQTPVIFNGVISRSDKPAEFWVNGKPQPKSGMVKKFSPGSGTVIIKSSSTQRSAVLKPGQKFDSNSGKVVEVYQQLPPSVLTIDNAGNSTP